jgi:hypothetical protein
MQVLLDELRKLKYQALSDQAAADLVNSQMVWIRVWVDTADAITHATQEGYYARMKHTADSDPPDENTAAYQCWQAAKNIIGFVESTKTQKIDMDSAKVIAMRQAMVGCGFATQPQATSLNALADRQVRWVDHVGIGTLGRGGVQNARKEINNAQRHPD